MAGKPVTDKAILELCKQVTGKRPRTVIDEILKKGFVTTEELQRLGYDHAPRARMDVIDNGVPLETFKVKSDRTGRMIAAYRFGDPSKIKRGRIGGRSAFSKQFRDQLIAKYGSADTISGTSMDARYLQIDHRIPYQVAGNDAHDLRNPDAFMLLDASNQRSKSWSCEHCENGQVLHQEDICRQCYWAFPESYTHIAMEPVRRVDAVWKGSEVEQYDRLKREADKKGQSVAEYLKSILKSLKL